VASTNRSSGGARITSSLSDQWVREGRLPDSPLLALIRAALVRAYAALLATVRY
jgi:hypothetical protein